MDENNSNSMNENVIEFLRGQKTATVTFANATRYNNKIRKMAEQYPDECQIVCENADGSIMAHIPVKWIRVTRSTGREFTEEEKKANTERLKSMRQTH